MISLISLAVRNHTQDEHHDVAALWGSVTVSALGTAVTTVALPLTAVFSLHATAFDVGVISAAGYAGWVGIGLPVGVWVDRLPRRAVLVACDLVRAAALLSVPLAVIANELTLGQLIAVALVISIGSVFFDVGFQSYVPSVVGVARLMSATSRMDGSASAARIGGAALGGAMVQILSAPLALLADMASYGASALCLLMTGGEKESPPKAAQPGGMFALVREGLGYVWRHPVLRPLLLMATSFNMWLAGLNALWVVFLVRSVGVTPGFIGILGTAEAIGGVLGAIVAPRLQRRLGTRRAVGVAVVAGPMISLLIPTTFGGTGLLLYATGSGGLALFVTVASIVARVYRQTEVPSYLLGRVTAVNRFVSWGIVPVGALLAGALGDAVGDRTALWIIVIALVAVTPLPVVMSEAVRSADLRAPSSLSSEGRSSCAG